jgi:hypothetical protein
MSCLISVYTPTRPYSSHKVGGPQEARDEAAQIIADRMDAFGDDREALRQYGWYTAEATALDMSDDGGEILLPDGWKIVITNNQQES